VVFRLLALLWDATVNPMAPEPVPLDPLVMVIQFCPVPAVQAHPDCVVTEAVPVPPDAANEVVFEVTEYVHDCEASSRKSAIVVRVVVNVFALSAELELLESIPIGTPR